MATVARYEALISGMIANDEPCGSPICSLTMMGHLLDGLPDELIDLVKALDDEWLAAHTHPTTDTKEHPF